MNRVSIAWQAKSTLPFHLLWIPGPPIQAFRVADPEEKSGTRPFTTTETIEDPERAIVCRQCGEMITRREAMVQMYGSHTHTCQNPAGLMFDIGCFAEASGCILHGDLTTAHTWFPGYGWRIALCSGCLEHLGWHFTAPSGVGFFGLILDRLVDEQ